MNNFSFFIDTDSKFKLKYIKHINILANFAYYILKPIPF